MPFDRSQPMNDEEVRRRLDLAREQLIESDLQQFELFHQCAIPSSVVSLYENHELLTQRHFLTRCGVVVRWFEPINENTIIHTAADGNRYAIFACVDDGESFCFPIGNNPDDCQIRVLWDSGDLETLELTADDLTPGSSAEIGG